MSVPFHSLTQNDWEKILLSNLNVQSGSGIVGYRGLTPYQRGYGIGSFLRALFRIARPIISKVGPSVAKAAKEVAKDVAKEGLESAAIVASDLIEGRNFKSSLKTRAKEGASRAFKKTVAKIPPKLRGYQRLENQEGSGRRKSTKRRKNSKPRKQKGSGNIGYKKRKKSIKRTTRNQLGFGKKNAKVTKSDYLGLI